MHPEQHNATALRDLWWKQFNGGIVGPMPLDILDALGGITETTLQQRIITAAGRSNGPRWIVIGRDGTVDVVIPGNYHIPAAVLVIEIIINPQDVHWFIHHIMNNLVAWEVVRTRLREC